MNISLRIYQLSTRLNIKCVLVHTFKVLKLCFVVFKLQNNTLISFWLKYITSQIDKVTTNCETNSKKKRSTAYNYSIGPQIWNRFLKFKKSLF